MTFFEISVKQSISTTTILIKYKKTKKHGKLSIFLLHLLNIKQRNKLMELEYIKTRARRLNKDYFVSSNYIVCLFSFANQMPLNLLKWRQEISLYLWSHIYRHFVLILVTKINYLLNFIQFLPISSSSARY